MVAQAVFNFSDERVLVTGSAGGIGLGIATAFGRAGATVVLLDRAAPELEQAAAAVREAGAASVTTVVCDLTSSAEITRAAVEITDTIGGIDVLVNNAGVGASRPLPELSDAELDLNLDVNLRAPILLTRELVKGMLDRSHGVIVNIASQAAKKGQAEITHYSASKAGVLGFTRSLAAELAPTIRVNSVSPGQVIGPMMENNIRDTSDAKGISWDESYAEWTSGIPMRRMQNPDNIADAVLFLASDQASEITGESMNVSGGLVTH